MTPEYNHSVPGALKNAIDYIDYQAAKKPAAIVSYGSAGGTRAAEHLKGILIESKLAVVPEAVAILSASGLPDESGSWAGNVSYAPPGTIEVMLEELAWWTATLKAGRKA